MKIAITGKGGVGKTTVAAILARLYADEDRKVLAADADPDANLGMALGFTAEEIAGITPISKMRELIAERTGAGAETFGKFFRITKGRRYSDMLAKRKRRRLVLGTIEQGGAGCACPEHNAQAGDFAPDRPPRDGNRGHGGRTEHLGRGTSSVMTSSSLWSPASAASRRTER